MPAVTADTLTLPRIDIPETGTPLRDRPVRAVTTAPRGFEGEGFPVRRAFAGIPKHELDPFIMMDQMGEVDYGPY
ncbi:MAG: pirin family protein, partial [Ilumatobacteraceae bacterium]